MTMETFTKMAEQNISEVTGRLADLLAKKVTPLDLLPHTDLREKFIELVLNGEPPSQDPQIASLFRGLSQAIHDQPVDGVKVVVFGGGTGLANVIGGDCRSDGWVKKPFCGLKEVFPRTRSVVCVTDDGGSTGELLKDLPLVAIGDIRHVLLSSIQLNNLQRRYQLSVPRSYVVASVLAGLFNFRFVAGPGDVNALIGQSGANISLLPDALRQYLFGLITDLYADPRLAKILRRPHCLGNLIVVSAIYRELPQGLSEEQLMESQQYLHEAIFLGLSELAVILGASRQAVLPCTSTPSQLRIRYSNGIQTSGEAKSSQARRGFPVDSVHVDFCDEPLLYSTITKDIAEADILILAPGSLYSSIIPVFKVPGMAQAVRDNTKALKVLVSNLWVQAGETDLSFADPERKFHVSDMIKAYERNIPGGTHGLFNEVLCLSLKDVPASIIQNYAVEGKVPIYLDRDVVQGQGYIPVECGIFSKEALAERRVIQHDPATLALAVKALYVGRGLFGNGRQAMADDTTKPQRSLPSRHTQLPCRKYRLIREAVANYRFERSCEREGLFPVDTVRAEIGEIIWRHYDIPLAHLQYTSGICCVDLAEWPRDQQWDNVYSFYDPVDRLLKIRDDQFASRVKLETAFLIALGESLLGDYARLKTITKVKKDGLVLGKAYHLHLNSVENCTCYFTRAELAEYLLLSRMCATPDPLHYTRLVNGEEGFTPPGLLLGLTYAWYLENRLASPIEYKMSAIKIPKADLIPEQKKMIDRRSRLISFFREVVFR